MVNESTPGLTLYLDACCLNRPFDDQTQVRIRLEAEAILVIIFQIHAYGWEWVGSEVLSYEIDQMPDRNRRFRVKSLMASVTRRVLLEPAIVTRAEEIQRLGSSPTMRSKSLVRRVAALTYSSRRMTDSFALPAETSPDSTYESATL